MVTWRGRQHSSSSQKNEAVVDYFDKDEEFCNRKLCTVHCWYFLLWLKESITQK